MNTVKSSTAAHATAAPLDSPSADSSNRAGNIDLAAGVLVPFIERGRAVRANAPRTAMTWTFGGTDAQGFWLLKDAYEACEVAQLLFLRKCGAAIAARSASVAATADGDPRSALLVNTRSSRAAVQLPTASVMLDDGTVERRIRLVRPIDERRFGFDAIAETHWRPTDRETFATLRDAEVAKVPDCARSSVHIVTGQLLPIWRRLPDDNCRVYQLQILENVSSAVSSRRRWSPPTPAFCPSRPVLRARPSSKSSWSATSSSASPIAERRRHGRAGL
jgi:hypothetical protein